MISAVEGHGELIVRPDHLPLWAHVWSLEHFAIVMAVGLLGGLLFLAIRRLKRRR